MRYFNQLLNLLAISFFLFPNQLSAQKIEDINKKQWKEIDSLIILKNLPKQALTKVNTLYNEVTKKQLTAEIIKALIYKMDLAALVNENETELNVIELKNEIKNSKNVVAKSILKVLLAKKYINYYQNNSWKVNNRTNTSKRINVDFTTWSKDDFKHEIDDLFTDALQPTTQLQKEIIANFNTVIIGGNNKKLRSSIYDLLAHEALDYYNTSNQFNSYNRESNNSKTIENIHILSTLNDFITHKFNVGIDDDHDEKSLGIFQTLIAFHQQQKNIDAFIDINVERIKWAYERLIAKNKEDLYLTALNEITTNYSNHILATNVWYLKAKYWYDKALTYDAFTNTSQQFSFKKALEIISQRLIAVTDSCNGNNNMKNLQKEILQKKLSGIIEKVNVPNEPFRLLVEYKNIGILHYRIVKLKNNLLKENEDDTEPQVTFWQKIHKQKYLVQDKISLPNLNDYQSHKTEVKINSLSTGRYALIGSNSSTFKDSNNAIFYITFNVSAISYINNNTDFFVLHRNTGLPLEDVQVTIHNSIWNSAKQKYENNEIAVLKTNEEGFFSVKNLNLRNIYNIKYSFVYKNDTLHSTENNYINASINNDQRTLAQVIKSEARVHFFTDRSLYRPTQIVKFKGIVTTKNKDAQENRLYLEYKKVKVELNDVNNKIIDTASFTLNEYGSFAGEFKLPLNGLTGSYNIRVHGINGYASFNVEEYKRPKFYVDFEKQKNAYKINDTFTIIGNANAYAGNKLDGAKVKFTVTRNARFANPWMFWRMPQPNSDSKQIVFGDAITDANGQFKIRFKAEPDNGIDKNTKPIFDYSIEASVTDLNGETREGNSSISVGYQSIILNINMADVVDIASTKNIAVSAENLAGEKQLKEIKIKLFPLTAEKRLIRKRYWDRSDVFVMSKEQYIKDFPYDEYENETDITNWKKEAVLVDNIFTYKNDSTSLDITNELNQLSKIDGALIEATSTDNDGTEIKALKYVRFTSQNKIAIPQYIEYNINKAVFNNNDTVQWKINSNASDIYLIKNTKYLSKKQGEEKERNNYENGLFNTNYLWSHKISSLNVERFGMFYAFVKHNRFYTGGNQIEIQKPDKNLVIQHAAFRNKTLPGAKETYNLTIKGKDGEAKAAEFLTAMYDASLDQFKPHNWSKPIFGYYEGVSNGFSGLNDNVAYAQIKESDFYFSELNDIIYYKLASSIWDFGTPNIWRYKNREPLSYDYKKSSSASKIRGLNSGSNKSIQSDAFLSETITTKFSSPKVISDEDLKTVGIDDKSQEKSLTNNPPKPTTQPRKNFNETAFFFPQLLADSMGNYSFSFTMPEALTQWKWLSLAHTKDLSFGLATESIITQKNLMVQPNAPRFLREGDIMEFTAKISNTSDKELTGTCTLELIDATNNNSVDGWFNNVFPNQYFTAGANSSTVVKFPIQAPIGFAKPLNYKVIAVAGNESDGEENTLPVLTNRILITESLPLYLKSNETTKNFTFNKLLNSQNANITNEALTVEYTNNPIFTVVKSLPYLIEYPYECAEQTFNRFFANALSASIVAKQPIIKKVFETWKKDTTALKSKLELNEELKSILLNETAWVADAENEAQQKKNIALLFDVVKMSDQMNIAIEKLQQLQMASGGFAWFKGGREDEYITQYILTGIGKLIKTKSVPKNIETKLNQIVIKALPYVDKRMTIYFDKYLATIKNKKLSTTIQCFNPLAAQYWYMRSFFIETQITTFPQKYFVFCAQEIGKVWMKQSQQEQALWAITMHRFLSLSPKEIKSKNVSIDILNSLKENAIEDTTKGMMYWKKGNTSYYWHQNNFETHTLIMEAFNEITKDEASLNALKTWLILNKQSNKWETTIATASACYALLNFGNNWLTSSNNVEIKIGKTVLKNNDENGLGYSKQRIEAKNIEPKMGNITITTKATTTNNSPSYGAVYYQFFQDINEVKSSSNNPLSLVKKLFIEKNNGTKKVLELVKENDELQVGDKLIVRIELRSDRQMEYLHLKDMRASATEPLNVLSSYKWQDGLGYYESTKDVATNFFIDRIERGTYVFDYPLYITHSGTFSVGIASLQCMYAPEFASHSAGIKIRVK